MISGPVRVLLVGAAGRMGKTIVNLAANDPNIEIVARCDMGDPIEPVIKLMCFFG
jgi:dihydrodipicolinate reductase